ncbi:MAG: hypothetical protein AB7I04_16285 [Pseudomonadales bacterium]
MSRVFHVVVAMIITTAGSSDLAASDLSECVRIDDPSERLICYDRLAGRSAEAATSRAQPSAGTTAVLPRAEGPPEPAGEAIQAEDARTGTVTDVDSFGLKEERSRSAEADSLTATIVSVQSSPTGAQIVTLSNGQIWIENQKSRRPIKPQQSVTIRRYRFHYEMELESQPDVTVRRLQ